MIRKAVWAAAYVAILFLCVGATFKGTSKGRFGSPEAPDQMFTNTEPLIATLAAIDRVAATVPAAMVSDTGTSTSLAARANNADDPAYDVPAEPWATVVGPPNTCEPTISTGGTYDLSNTGRDILTLALDYAINDDAASGAAARSQILALAGTSGFNAGSYSRGNQCILDLAEALPSVLDAALILEGAGLPTWTEGDKIALADWVVDDVFTLLSWGAEGSTLAGSDNANNWAWGSARAAQAAAYFVDGYRSPLTLADASTITPAAYYATRIPNTVIPALLAGGQDTCFDYDGTTGMQSSGALPEEMRRSGDEDDCSQTSIDFACVGDTGPPYDTLGDCDGNNGAPFYQGKAMQAFVGLCEGQFRIEGDGSTCYDLTSHGGANEAVYDGLLMATTLASGSLGFFSDVYARDGVIGGYLLAAEYFNDGCMAEVLRDDTVDSFSDVRGGTDMPWMSLLAYPGVRDTNPAPACPSPGSFVTVAASDVSAYEDDFPYVYSTISEDDEGNPLELVDTTDWTVYDVTCEAGTGCTPFAGTQAFPASWNCDPSVGDDSTDNSGSLLCLWAGGTANLDGNEINSGADASDEMILFYPDGTYNHSTNRLFNQSIVRPNRYADHRGIRGESRSAILQTDDIEPDTQNVSFFDSEDCGDCFILWGATDARAWNSGNGADRGATTIEVGAGAIGDFEAGGWVILTADSAAPQTTSPLIMRTKIASVGSTSFEIDRPLVDDFRTSNATARRWYPAEKLVIENITMRDKYPNHQDIDGFQFNFKHVAESHIIGSELQNYMTDLWLQQSARIAMRRNYIHGFADKPYNTYGIASASSTHLVIVDNYFVNVPEGYSCGGSDQGILFAFNHMEDPEANADYDIECDSGVGGDECDQYLASHTSTVAPSFPETEHGTTLGGGYTHCSNNNVGNVTGFGGQAACHGTRSPENSGSILSHGPSCNNSAFVRNFFEGGWWSDWDGGPGRRNLYYGNVAIDGGAPQAGGLANGGDFSQKNDVVAAGAVAQHEWNPLFINNNIRRLGGASAQTIDAGMNGAIIVYNVIREDCYYDGGFEDDPDLTTPNATAASQCVQASVVDDIGIVAGATITWANNEVGYDHPTTPTADDDEITATMPSAPGFLADPELGGSTPFPYIGADIGVLGGTGSGCLPAKEREDGSC